MRIDHELIRRTFFRALVPLRCLIEIDYGYVESLCGMYFIVQDCHHELATVAQHRALTRMEGAGLRPTQTDANTESADLCSFIHSAWIACHVQARNTDRAACTNHLLQRVENRRR